MGWSLVMKRKEYHFPFIIFHLTSFIVSYARVLVRTTGSLNGKSQMKNEKWKMKYEVPKP